MPIDSLFPGGLLAMPSDTDWAVTTSGLLYIQPHLLFADNISCIEQNTLVYPD